MKMSYRELGEARILKRYVKTDFIEPMRGEVSSVDRRDDWQPLGLVTQRFLRDIKSAGVTTQ